MQRSLILLVLCLCSICAAETTPPAAPAKPTVSAWASYPFYRRTKVSINAPPAASGATALLTSEGLELGKAVLDADGKGTVILPMPPRGKPWGTVMVAIPGQEPVKAFMPNADRARDRTVMEADIVFRPSVFSDVKFPSCDFRETMLMEDLIGPYTIKTTFYDNSYKPVLTAEKPGRYGAVTVVSNEQGVVLTRCITLYRMPEGINWWNKRVTSTLELPAAAGVDAVVWREQPGVVSDFIGTRISGAMNDGSQLPALLSLLSELKPGTPALTQRQSVRYNDPAWWFPLKKQLGLAKHRYLTFLPAGYETDATKQFPLILFLHGGGERGFDLNMLRNYGPHCYWEGKQSPFIIVAPQCDPGSQWSPFALADLLDEVQSTLRVDDKRMYLTGVSMGGFGSWATAAAYPERFAAIAPICGGGDVNEVSRIATKPLWVFHGAKDDVVPLASSTEMVDALKAAKSNVRFTVYPEARHDSWLLAYAEAELYTWMLQQHLP